MKTQRKNASEVWFETCLDERGIVALANPHGLWTSIEQPEDVIAVMYGNPAYVVNVASPEWDGGSIFAEDGAFAGCKHRYISAVCDPP